MAMHRRHCGAAVRGGTGGGVDDDPDIRGLTDPEA
jgi:hypothetical protein